jgi:aspartyl protease family protein
MRFIKIAGILATLGSLPAAAGDIMVLGLFKDKAVVSINGKQRSLAPGQISPEGVTLISASSNGAVLEVEGKRRSYPLGSQVNTQLAAPKHTAVQVYPNPAGMYTTVGSINGLPVNFLLDTGATFIAMNANEAKRLGLSYRLDGQRTVMSTASGMAEAFIVKLAKVKVGEIELRDVDAAVIVGDSPTEVLLGMSFLGKLEIQHKEKVMELRKKL